MKVRYAVSTIFLLLVLQCAGLYPESGWAQNATLSGIVLDEKTEQPVSGAKVELSNSNAGTGYFVTQTDADGRFTFTQVRSGLYYDLGVLAEGYCPYEMPSWSVPENQNAVELRIPLIQGSVIDGVITTSDGIAPLANVQITLIYENGDFQMLNSEQTLYTDAEGHFSFPQIPPNQYRLSISRGGYIAEQIVGIRPQPGEKKTYAVKLYKPASISGTVMLQENNSPLSGIEIGTRGASQRAANSDENGFFTIGGLKPGAYQLHSRPAGFSPFQTSAAISLQEGENHGDESIHLISLPPALSVSLRREVFLPDQELVFQIRTFRIGRYRCDIHAIPASVFLDEEMDIRLLAENADLSPFTIVRHWMEEVDFNNPYVWIDRNVKAPEKLPPGSYVLRISSPEDKVQSRVLFFITEIGIIVKRGEKNTFVYATNLKTSLPVQKTRIRIVSHDRERKKQPGWTETLQQKPLEEYTWHGETDEQGIAMIQHPYSTAFADAIALSPEGFLAVAQLNQSQLIHSQSQTIFAYTDRPVYRPGHTVYYKAIIRVKEEKEYRIPIEENYTVQVTNPEEDIFFTAEQTTNEWGSINGSLTIPADAPLGEYRLTAVSGSGVQNSISFYVEEYRKPEFKVEITPGRPYYINGEALAFTVKAEYYFGAPVPHAAVRYRFYESYATERGSHDYPSSYSTFLSSGEIRTDAEGMTQIEFTPDRSSRDRQITLEADITEASGRQVSSSAVVPVGVGAFYIKAQPDRHVFDRETPLQVTVETLTHDEKPVSVPVLVEFIQEVWNPVRRRYERPSHPQASRTSQTDEKGHAVVDWLPDTDISGRIEITVSSQDETGNRITASTQLWRMAFRAGSFDLQYPTLEGILDKDSYQSGEEATLLINTNYPENPVILTIEARDILLYRVIWPAARTTAITIPVLPEYGPNVYVSLFMPRETNLSTRTYNLNIPERRGDLNIEVIPDRPKYRPGEAGTVTIKTTLPDGSPVSAEVSLAVVDEAIFAIRSDRTPNIHSIFYDRQSNWVVTTFSYPLKYFGGANKGVFPDLRKDFRDTALWVANVYTDENGTGSAEFSYPDNLTTWRLTARGHTKNTEVGWKRGKTIVTKDIVARLSLPRFFVESDRVYIPTQVNNLSETNLPDIQTRLNVQGGVELKDATEKIAQAAAGAVARENWNVSVTAASPTAFFTFEAQSETDRDALQIQAPVLPIGFLKTQFLTGKMEEKTNFSLPLENSTLLSHSRFSLTLTPSLAAVALGAIPYLTDFPYGCVEQTLNGFLPNVLLLHTLNEVGALSEDEKAKIESLADRVEKSCQRIYSMQKDEGGWGWFTDSPEDLALTALVVHGLHQIHQLGYTINEDRLEWGVNSLQSNISQYRIWDIQAFASFVLSEFPDNELPMLDEFYTNRNELHDFGLAVAALAFHNRQKEKEANEILDLLLSRLQNLSDRHAAWETSPESMWSWNGLSTETTAWGLKALIALRGMNPPADRIVQWLIDQRWGNRWRSTRETAAVVEALCLAIQNESRNSIDSDWQYEIQVNQKTIQQETLPPERITQPRSIDLPLQPGNNDVLILSNRPQGYWSLNASLFHRGETQQPIVHSDFQLARLLERAIHTRDYRGRPKILTESLSPDDTLKVGEEILVTLLIRAKQDLPYMIVEDPLPSGCETIDSFLVQARESWTPYTRYERRDRKMVFFLDSVPKGETRIEYLVRTEMQGTFHINPTHAWCMYYPDYSVLSGSNRLNVK